MPLPNRQTRIIEKRERESCTFATPASKAIYIYRAQEPSSYLLAGIRPIECSPR